VVARIFLERRDLITVDDDLKRVFDQLDPSDVSGPHAECTLPLDVVETAAAIEVVMDLPGVSLEDLSILFVRNTLVITGRKLPGRCDHRGAAAFHLAERTFGRFARGVRLAGAFDAGRADATLRAGELRITLPRITERRGAKLRIAVRAD
jgi:HSP20 family protein